MASFPGLRFSMQRHKNNSQCHIRPISNARSLLSCFIPPETTMARREILQPTRHILSLSSSLSWFPPSPSVYCSSIPPSPPHPLYPILSSPSFLLVFTSPCCCCFRVVHKQLLVMHCDFHIFGQVTFNSRLCSLHSVWFYYSCVFMLLVIRSTC